MSKGHRADSLSLVGSTLQVWSWVEVGGPDETLILQELSNHEPDIAVPGTADTGEEQWLAMQFTHDKLEPASGNSPVWKKSDRLTINCIVCRADVPRPLRNRNKRLKVR
jgi:hypothetical protein